MWGFSFLTRNRFVASWKPTPSGVGQQAESKPALAAVFWDYKSTAPKGIIHEERYYHA